MLPLPPLILLLLAPMSDTKTRVLGGGLNDRDLSRLRRLIRAEIRIEPPGPVGSVMIGLGIPFGKEA